MSDVRAPPPTYTPPPPPADPQPTYQPPPPPPPPDPQPSYQPPPPQPSYEPPPALIDVGDMPRPPWFTRPPVRIALALVLFAVGILVFLGGRGGKSAAAGEGLLGRNAHPCASTS